MERLRLKRIQKPRALLVGHFDGFPVEEVSGFLALDFPHQAAPGVRARIGRGLGHGLLQGGWAPETFDVSKGESQAAVGVDVVKFQVLRLEPGVAPLDALTAAESLEQEFLSTPLTEAKER